MATISVFSIMHNEEALLPYFLRHYQTFADRIFIIDAYSLDRTREIAKKHPKVTLLECPYGEVGFTEDDISRCYEEYVKKYARGYTDWAICVDGDEFVYHPNIKMALKNAADKHGDVVRTTCFTMVSDHLPTTKGQIYEELNEGVRTDAQDKPIIFRPEKEVKFTHGRHTLVNRDDLHIERVKIKLLHYRYLGLDYTLARTDKLLTRLGEREIIKSYRLRRNRNWYNAALKKREKAV